MGAGLAVQGSDTESEGKAHSDTTDKLQDIQSSRPQPYHCVLMKDGQLCNSLGSGASTSQIMSVIHARVLISLYGVWQEARQSLEVAGSRSPSHSRRISTYGKTDNFGTPQMPDWNAEISGGSLLIGTQRRAMAGCDTRSLRASRQLARARCPSRLMVTCTIITPS